MLKTIPLDFELDENPILKDCDFFAQAQVWPIHLRMDPREWLQNFREDELPYAYDLLRSFLYYSEPLSVELFRSAVQRLGHNVLNFNHSDHYVKAEWNEFIEGLIIVPVRGETPRPTDSGYMYVRSSREIFGFKESQFYEVDEALRLLRDEQANGTLKRSILFVDDFVGTGNQFVDTWFKKVKISDELELSFEQICRLTTAKFFYCPLICTEIGAYEIRSQCHKVVLSPAHILTEDYSAFHPESKIWSPERRGTAVDVLQKIAIRSGMPESGTDSWRGYYDLGLGIAIRDAIPDANLGVFKFNQNGWIPLFKKLA